MTDYEDISTKVGVVEFMSNELRTRYRNIGDGRWAWDEWDDEGLDGGGWVCLGTVKAPQDATPEQLDRTPTEERA